MNTALIEMLTLVRSDVFDGESDIVKEVAETLLCGDDHQYLVWGNYDDDDDYDDEQDEDEKHHNALMERMRARWPEASDEELLRGHNLYVACGLTVANKKSRLH